MPRLKTKDEFVIDSIKAHGNKYDYSLSEYFGNKVKVKIICEEHGVFMQLPCDHTKGRGCSRCAAENCLNYNLKAN